MASIPYSLYFIYHLIWITSRITGFFKLLYSKSIFWWPWTWRFLSISNSLYSLHHLVILKVLFSSPSLYPSQTISQSNFDTFLWPWSNVLHLHHRLLKRQWLGLHKYFRRVRLCERICEDLLFHSQDLWKHAELTDWSTQPFRRTCPRDFQK